MLLPRYSLRHVLAATVVLSLVFLVAAQAARGEAWATGVTVAVATVVLSLGVYVLTFLAIWVFGVPYQTWWQRRKGMSPFEELPEPLLAGSGQVRPLSPPGAASAVSAAGHTGSKAAVRPNELPAARPEAEGDHVGKEGTQETLP
jgi:hypothetical protein